MNTFKKVAGSAKRTSEPGLVGVILQDYFEDSNEPLAVAYRSLFPDTHLGVDLKVMNDEPKHMDVGETLDGTLARDGEYHFLFEKKSVEKKAKAARRNPIIFAGGCVNVHLLADGTKRLEFNRPHFYPDFTFRDFCIAAAQELLTIARLLEGKGAGELPR